MDLALNNLQKLICHKTQQTKPTCYLNSYLITCCINFEMQWLYMTSSSYPYLIQEKN